MLRSAKKIRGYTLAATDGTIGKIDDLCFDDVSWVIRYFVADTRRWLPGRLVLISPASLGEPDWRTQTLPADLSKEQIRNAPGVASDQPVSRQFEMQLARYYAWPTYWSHDLTAGREYPRHAAEAATAEEHRKSGTAVANGADPHLRSLREVTGYAIQASDGELGHVEDLIVETASWTVRYVVIDTRTWWPGEKILVSPDWIDDVRWSDRIVSVDLTREMIKSCPRYDATEPVNREYETRLYDYYGRPKYWW